MRLIICVLTLLASLSLQAQAAKAKIYVWRNEQGVLVYSDTPRPGAEEVKVAKPNNMSANIDTSILDINPQKLKDDFIVEISQPEKNETIRDNTGSVYIAGRIKPLFKQGFKIQLYFDGKKYQKPQTRAIYILRNVDRGEHQIKMALINKKGKIIATSDTTTFYMHRASVNKAN